MTTTTAFETTTRGASAVLHGRHPLRGYPVTWHLTPLADSRRGHALFLVERADGHIDDDVAWQLAEKEVSVMSTQQMCDVVRRSAGPGVLGGQAVAGAGAGTRAAAAGGVPRQR